MQAERLRVEKLLSLTLYTWRIQLEAAREEARKTDQALWHWSVVLECKVKLNIYSQINYRI